MVSTRVDISSRRMQFKQCTICEYFKWLKNDPCYDLTAGKILEIDRVRVNEIKVHVNQPILYHSILTSGKEMNNDVLKFA